MPAEVEVEKSLLPTDGDVGKANAAVVTGGQHPSSDALAGLAALVAAVAERDRLALDFTDDVEVARRKFLGDFATACEAAVRPAMQAVLERLHALGGGGLIEQHAGDEARYGAPRLALWMSLKGEVVAPRMDRYPYLLFEADEQTRKVQVDEGDMWRGAGGNTSGRVGAWEVTDLTLQRVTDELLAITQRAAA